MPLLYRILMRLAAVATVLGFVLGVLGAIAMSGLNDFWNEWPLLILLALIPAAALYALAWIVRPPLDRASLRRLWRE